MMLQQNVVGQSLLLDSRNHYLILYEHHLNNSQFFNYIMIRNTKLVSEILLISVFMHHLSIGTVHNNIRMVNKSL